MVKEIQIRVPIKETTKEGILEIKAAQQLKINRNTITSVKVLRKSIDARKAAIIFNYKLAVYINEQITENRNNIVRCKYLEELKFTLEYDIEDIEENISGLEKWNPKFSWKRKWKTDANGKLIYPLKERFKGSSTVFVLFTDMNHATRSLIRLIKISVALNFSGLK